ncbi:hypothetical protein FACS189444_5190 [Spirochaetia bacterium]|nr:hypothetical protein FACS189444_5190 [Spirochaetia bacterium]
MSKVKRRLFVDTTNYNQERDYLDRIVKDKGTHQEYQTNRLFEPIFSRYTTAYNRAGKAYLRIHVLTIIAESRSLFIFITVMFCAYLYVGSQIVSGFAAIGLLISLMLIFDNLHGKSAALSYFISNRMEEMLVVDDYYEILHFREAAPAAGTVAVSAGEPAICFRNVSYAYPQAARKALEGFNITIRGSEKIAIVGENGSGKTTFSNILLDLLHNFDGEVQIGNSIYNRDNPVPLSSIKCLSQDFSMYQTSIRENILIGNQNASDAELSGILNTIGMGEFVRTLPETLETHLGQLDEKGIELSRGQQQKLAVGRLLVNPDTPIWIFDEPTAYLDPMAEIEMYNFLYELSNDKTMLFISHRLGFAKRASRIIVFDQGKIVETGAHEDLLKRNGTYAAMYDAQKTWYA